MSTKYVDDLGHVDREKLKDRGKYLAKAVAWTINRYKSKPTVVIRYKAQTSKGEVR